MPHLLNCPKKRCLGTLRTSCGALDADGGAEFDADGFGYFIPRVGEGLRPVAQGTGAEFETAAGEIIRVANLDVAPPTVGLPARYTFTHTRSGCAEGNPRIAESSPSHVKSRSQRQRFD
jgi:hypothetical protein